MQIKTQQPFKRIDIVPNHTLIPLACQTIQLLLIGIPQIDGSMWTYQ